MFYQIKSYIKFLLKSTNQHGVHSPFVFNLVTQCFYDRSKYEAYEKISNYKKALLNNITKIKVTDLGVGSHAKKQQTRMVSEIAKNAGTTIVRAKLLYRLSAYFKFDNILELGTSLGIATQALSLGNPKAHITTIEGCPNISEFTRAQFEKHTLKNIHLMTGDFNDTLKNLAPQTFHLIFFDGNHQKEATLAYFESLLTKAHNDSIFIFDDIYWSKSMTEAWESIKNHPKVSVTIDTFFWGFVFFRKEQIKQHFTIRI